MRQCPKCKQITLEFDDYFGRYRCFNPECAWMPTSVTEREIRLLREREEPKVISNKFMPQLDTTVIVSYDLVNDALSFNFKPEELTFDLPESDGRMIWKISRDSNTIVGFEILEAKELGVSEVKVNILKRKEDIERDLKTIKDAFSLGRPTRLLITCVSVKRQVEETGLRDGFFREAVDEFQREFCET